MCTDGQSPLMEANDAFPCARGCPMGFYCEMQDPLLTPSMGICCANRAELRLLYGDDNHEHADPIWDRKTPRKSPNTAISSAAPPPPSTTPVINQVDTTEPFLSGSTESPNSTSPVTSGADLSSSFPEPTTLPVDANSVTVEAQVTTEESSTKASTSAESAMGEDQTSSSTLNKADGPIVEQTTPTLMPLQPLDGSTGQVTPIDPPTGTSPELPASDSQVMSLIVEGQDLVEGSSVPLEDAPIVTSTVDDHTLTEELNVDSTEGGVGAPQVEESPSAPEEMVREVADVDSPTKKTEQDSLATDGEQATFRCRSDSVDTQPTIRWYLNEKGECEYYPWGYCPGDRVVDSSTIRTKAECERECLNGAKNRTEDTPFAARLPEATLAGSPEQDIETGTDSPSEKLESKEKPEETLTPAPVTNVTLEVSVSPGPEEKSTSDLSAPAHDETVNAMADQEGSMESHSQEESSATTETRHSFKG
ncbi:Kunitz/Bovine pancreatic trypsin inhibitor domain protein [Cooperia oncophora]